MRVKVGDTWYKAEPGQPIMVELKPGDRQNIANMLPEATKYAVFDDSEPLTREQMLKWVEE